ncbi:MAG: DUF2062 domain-containing protein [Thermodesulfobacteriota bacterium]
MPTRLVRYHYLKFLRLQGDPKIIARGVAIGIFIGITPTIPLHTVLILGTCLIFRASKVAGILASVVVSNPLTFFIQYYLSWLVGTAIFPGLLSWQRLQEMMDVLSSAAGYEGFKASLTAISSLGLDAITVLVVGGTLLALPFTALSYYYSLKLFTKLRDTRQRKKEQVALSDESK